MSASSADQPVGSVSDEAAKLLRSLGSSAPFVDEPPRSVPAPDNHESSCTWCPVCRGLAIARSLSPEVLARLAEVAEFAAGALGELAEKAAKERPTAAGERSHAAKEHSSEANERSKATGERSRGASQRVDATMEDR